MANVDRTKLLLKADALVELLRTHFAVYVHVDTRVAGVLLPKQLLNRPQVCLELGLSLPNPIREFGSNEEGWHAVLCFGGPYFRCFIPWKAVFFIVGDSGFGASWPQDTPPEAVVQPAADAAADGDAKHGSVPIQKPVAPAAPKRALPKGWRVIEGGGSLAQARAEAKKAVPLKSDKDPQPRHGYRKPGPFPPAS